MAANRLTRDQICNRGLDLADSPRLNEKCRAGGSGPSATITDPSLVTGWFQEGLDLAHTLYPLGGTLKTTTFTFAQGESEKTLPSDFILGYPDGLILDDYKNGVVDGVKGRLAGPRSLSRLLQWQTGSGAQGQPKEYTIKGTTLIVRPVANQGPSPAGAYTGTFHYYGLPVALTGGQTPLFPSDMLLVDFVAARAKEWLRELPAGSAQAIMCAAMAKLQSAGIQQEAEEDTLGIDRTAFPGTGGEPSGWQSLDATWIRP